MPYRYWVYVGAIILMTYIIYKYVTKKDFQIHRVQSTVIISLILSIATCLIINYVGIKRHGYEMGHFFEKQNYERQFYVYVTEDLDTAKSYRLTADIRKNEFGYFFLKAYWPNGGTLSFGDPVKFYGRTSFPVDDNDKEWRIELTEYPVFSSSNNS
ncbi:hypothetical protein [Paenibacillus sp. MMO-58]|uniref:hypothetical protein n=1 Tax=Paenibacillus sp. MMO-58 TaxID=3081290 RepID=UPI00301A0AA4